MKKKLLEVLEHKISNEVIYLKYLIRASIEVIEGESILFLSFYKDLDRAIYKVFINKDSYITQVWEKDHYRWSKSSLRNLIGWYAYYNNPVDLIASCHTIDEREYIAEYLDTEFPKVGHELELIMNYQQKLMNNRLEDKHKRIKAKIDEVMDRVPELPKYFDNWIEKGPFHESKYIYYKREGKTIKSYCTHCKRDMDLKEDKNIKHNNSGTCPKCKNKVTYKAIGKSKNIIDRVNFAIMQRMDEGFIVRHFAGSKIYREHYKDPRIIVSENVREVFRLGSNGLIEAISKYDHTLYPGTNEVRWCNGTDNYSNYVSRPYLYSKNLKNVLENTRWKYSCIKEFTEAIHYVNIYRFLKTYIEHPGIEYLIKLKFYNLTNDFIHNYYQHEINLKCKDIKEALNLSKEGVKQLQRLDLGVKGLNIIRDLKKPLIDSQLKWVYENVDTHDFIRMTKHTTNHKIIKYIKSQAKAKYSASSVLHDWIDYIRQCEELKFDIKNTFVFFPKDLQAKHEEYSILTKVKNAEKYDKKVKKAAKTINDKYSFSNSKFTIRAANDVTEIIKEGHKLRHCVGGTQYVKSMAEGSSAIMFIRTLNEPDEPYYTLELNLKTMRVVQCRGFKNCDMNSEVIKFVESWKKGLINILREVV